MRYGHVDAILFFVFLMFNVDRYNFLLIVSLLRERHELITTKLGTNIVILFEKLFNAISRFKVEAVKKSPQHLFFCTTDKQVITFA